jgi:hypothetical protein
MEGQPKSVQKYDKLVEEDDEIVQVSAEANL